MKFFKTKYEKLTKKYRKDLLSSLKDFVAIKSVYDDSTVNKANPFGEGVSNALNYFTNLATNYGFKTTNYNNKVVEAIVGDGDKNITIMAHADVVPEGTGWEKDPFTVFEKGDTLIGRGVSDDKGPCLAAFYAIVALRNAGLLGNYQVRLLVGGNEERGSACMDHYFNVLKKPQPTLGFSPDADFPLIYAEKGIFNFTVKKSVKLPKVISIKGGEASNAVIEKCTIQFELDDKIIPFLLENAKGAEIVTKEDIVNVTFTGVGAHGSTPQLGKNAGMMALECLSKFTSNSVITDLIEKYSDVYGKGINAFNSSKELGKTSCNVGLLDYDGEEISLTVNFRHGEGATGEALIENIKEANKGYRLEFTSPVPVLYIPKTSPLIKTLMKAYVDETGDRKSKPLAIGGGTYAKEASNVVAFGMEFKGHDSHMHTCGECVEKEHLFKAMAIYARAIVELGKLIDEDKI